MFDFVFVILSIAGLLGLLTNAALHEVDDKRPIRVRNDATFPSD